MAQTAEILEALPPAQEQPAGLALLDLNVTATPLVITWDRKPTCPPSKTKWRG